MRLTSVTALTFALAGAFSQAHAATYDWTVWSSNSSGTAGSVAVTFAGEMSGIDQYFPDWFPASTYADGSIVSNAPTSANRKLVLFGGTPTVNTITFSTAVTNPVLAIFSLGQPGTPASFEFTQTPTVVAGGPNSNFGGGSIIAMGNSVTNPGGDGNGTVQFVGTYTSLSWTNPSYENYYGFTVGVVQAPVPEPETYVLMLAGLGALGFVAKRRTH
jgi:hypothetical protein